MVPQMSRLRVILRLNALSCLVFGSLFLIWPTSVALFLGTVPRAMLIAIGGVLVLNGLHLIFASTRKHLMKHEILWFSSGDLIWWLASLGLVLHGQTTQGWINTGPGIPATIITATCVAGLGVAQVFEWGRHQAGLSSGPYWQRIGSSWLALPLAVKLWLFWLNAVFISGLAFWPDPVARVTLTAYVATGPLLLAMVVYQGGLTRLLGVAHLIIWGPMLIWFWQAYGAGSLTLELNASRFVMVLSATTLVCLGFDLWDLRRWLRGERAIMGRDL